MGWGQSSAMGSVCGGSLEAWTLLPALRLTSSVNLDRALNLYRPQLLIFLSATEFKYFLSVLKMMEAT